MPNNENDNRDIIAVRSNAQKPEEAPERPAAQTENKDASQRPQPKRTARRTVSFGETRTAAGAQEPTRKMDPVDQQEKKTVESEPEKTPRPSAKPRIKDRGGITISLIKALIYIAAVLAISGFIGVTGIRWGNDVFAFVKEEKRATVVIPEYSTVDEIADILKTNGLISEPQAFKFWVKYKYRNKNLVIVPGTYELVSTMNYDQMLYEIRQKAAPREIVEVTVPEGYTVDQIIDMLTNELHIGTREGYVAAINEYPYEYRFMEELNKLQLSPDRKYRLEGYIFPARYEIYTDLSEVGVIDYFLSAFEKRFEKSYYDRLTELDMTLDEAVTLASMIQAEGKFDSEYYLISSVFHNRLNSSDFKKLESDATINYYLPERKEELSREDLETPNPYNTYLNEGLPPGAICNPGLEAIHAALYPDDTNYLYFVADADGHSLFAQTLAQHNANKRTAAANKEAMKEEEADQG